MLIQVRVAYEIHCSFTIQMNGVETMTSVNICWILNSLLHG